MSAATKSLAILAVLCLSGCAFGKRPPTEAAAPLPRDPKARLEIAYREIEAKNWPKVIAVLDSLIDEQPENLQLRMQRGYARQAAGELSAAADEFRIVERQPGEYQEQARSALAELDKESTGPAFEARRDTLLNEGYSALREGRTAVARESFQRALQNDPSRTDVSRQLAYMSIEEGKLTQAAKEFEGVRKLEPRDGVTALELGYVYVNLHNDAAAEKQFTAALASPNERVRKAAEAALYDIRSRDPRLYLDLYASPYYTTRFRNRIVVAEAQAGWKPAPRWPVALYLGTRYTKDTRSSIGTEPELYSDNAWAVGPGIRVQPRGWNLNLAAEWNEVFNLKRAFDHSAPREPETRVVLSDYRWWDGPARSFADLGASAGYYSRYRGNTIAYAQLRAGFKLFDNGFTRLSAYVPGNVIKDTNDDYYNNLAETGAGVELQPWAKLNLKLRAEYLRGFYMGIQGRDPNPYRPQYDDVRLTLAFSARLARVKELPPDGWQDRVDRSGRAPLRW